jgi:hypothetical protein
MEGLSLNRIPIELKQRKQWCISLENKAPLSSTDGKTLFTISVTDPTYWLDFTSAVYLSKKFDCNFGYILHADDPFTCIDLDVIDEESQSRKGQPIDSSKWSTQDHFDRYWKIITQCNSYTETSKNKKGFHIWVKGKIGNGLRRDGVEIYSQERYIICTGSTILNRGLNDCQDILNSLASQIRPISTKIILEEVEEEFTDAEIVSKALAASNSEKFNDLCNGNFSSYPSQSEADLALMSMFTFYSKSNEQCKRLFRYSELGKREKAIRDDKYLNNSLRTIRSREANDKVVSDSATAIAMNLVSQLQTQRRTSEFLHSDHNIVDEEQEPSLVTAFSEITVKSPPKTNDGLEWPPGIAGKIAYHIYMSSPRPVKEVAIVATLGLLAGIVGKSWTITQSGLNMYMILIARSGVGKEAMHSGISNLVHHIAKNTVHIEDFISFSDFASGQALINKISTNPCLLTISGEWGRKLQRLAADDGRDAAMQSLRTVMTDLYQKSGPTSIVGGIDYAKKDNNIASVSGVAYSMIGETTPDTFHECLTNSMMSDGFLSRFNMVSYDGERPPLNKDKIMEPDAVMVDFLVDLVNQSKELSEKNNVIHVERDEFAAKIISDFEIECDNNINGSQVEAWRQMWNRAALKVLKLAAILAVADNSAFPTIRDFHLNWALSLVRKDIKLMICKMESGDIGVNDLSRELKVIEIIKYYLLNDLPDSLKTFKKMKDENIITRKYIQQKISNINSFTKHPQGAIAGFNSTLRSMIDSGYIIELSKEELVTSFGFHGKAYRVLDLKNTI